MQDESGRNVATTQHAVVIAGGGPTGLMLAAELKLARVDVVIVERREGHELEGLRAGGLHSRTIEVLDQRGILDRFMAQAQVYRIVPFAGGMLERGDIPTRHNYYLAIWQTHVERLLTEWVAELGVPIYRGCEVTSFVSNDRSIDVELSDGRALSAKYLVGCDGGRSVVRKKAGIDFPGWDPTTSYLIAEMETSEEPEWGLRNGKTGMDAALHKLEDGRARVVLVERQVGKTEAPTLHDIREALIHVYGKDFGLRSAAYISRFTDMARQAASYRQGRVLLAGDAAHVHSPIGGQGLNIGVQDAVNLGWKLAQVVHGTAPESSLDSYHAERHPVGARLLRNTIALTTLERGDERGAALRSMLSEMMRLPATRDQYIAMMSGLDVHYDLGAGHPLLGRRMPDLDLDSQRVANLLNEAHPVLLNLGKPGAFDIEPWADRVRVIDARYTGAWALPVIGAVAPPSAVLIRPDGYVAWVGEGTADGLREALVTWFGPGNRA